MQKDRGFRTLAIVAICVAVAGLTIGFAALNTSLNVSTTATVKGNTWEIAFENLSQGLFTGDAEINSNPTITATQINLDVNLTKPGDSVVYTFDVKNKGTIAAKLSQDPTLTGVTEAAAENIIYTLTYADGTEIKANDTLAVDAVRTLKLTVTFDSSATTVPSTDTTYNLSATLLYVQQ